MMTARLPAPPTANNLFPTGKSGKRFCSKPYTNWKAEAARVFQKTRDGAIDAKARVGIKYEYAFADKRARDIANFEKAVTDFLVQQGVIADDCQIDEIHLFRLPKVSDAAVFLTIWELQNV
jgi:crossover junction endodeoxyribonuclease RusA